MPAIFYLITTFLKFSADRMLISSCYLQLVYSAHLKIHRMIQYNMNAILTVHNLAKELNEVKNSWFCNMNSIFYLS